MTTSERLQSYYKFDESVLRAVESVADTQNQQHYSALARHYRVHQQTGITDLQELNLGSPVEFMYITPIEKYDYERAKVLHLPMAIGIDPSSRMRAIRLFAADPTEQLVVFGNPSGIFSPGSLSPRDARRVWSGDLEPTVRTPLGKLRSMGIKNIDQIGYSYGADRAATATAEAHKYGITVERQILMEPASVVPGRGTVALGKAFKAAGATLQTVIAKTGSKPLAEARELVGESTARFALHLSTMSNLAIAHALTGSRFEARVAAALEAQPTVRTAFVVGSESEITPQVNVMAVRLLLGQKYPGRVIDQLDMHGMYHTGADDIDLHAAMILQARLQLDQAG